MKIVISGGTGLIGRALIRYWLKEKHEITVLTRLAGGNNEFGSHCKLSEWNPRTRKIDLNVINGADAVINLAGTGIADHRWSKESKKLILRSRIESTSCLVESFSSVSEKPKVFISASAVGFYGASLSETFDEKGPSGQDFLARVCSDWESEALKARPLGIRTCLMRTGIVLSNQGGALEKMLPVFRLGLGGPLGGGQQWMSWIHIWDLVQLFNFCLTEFKSSGPFNATAPIPVTNLEFSKRLAQVLGRPCFINTPSWVLRLTLGEMATLILGGQRVLPARSRELGFEFSFSDLNSALSNLLKPEIIPI
ncbi:MAG: TIGR01777 family oxidoreductase [Pseudomonadota bacterium]|nr:TIGR01777 family oxidoreductase [Pseudomonadota bacterium]